MGGGDETDEVEGEGVELAAGGAEGAVGADEAAGDEGAVVAFVMVVIGLIASSRSSRALHRT